MNNYHKHLELIINEARKHKFPLREAMEYYIHSYDTHKRYYGSFKGIKDYHKKMCERENFMYQETLAFIREGRK